MEPLVSVIIPAYNEEQYIEETLKCLAGQTYPHVEIIVSDGKSTDRTVEIARRYADEVVVRRTNIAEARNLGARHARGDIMVFVDADTLVSRELIAHVVGSMTDPTSSCVFGPIRPIKRSTRSMFICKIGWDLIPQIFVKCKRPQFSGVCVAIRRSAFEQVGGFNEGMKATEDIDMGLRLRKTGRVVFNKKAVSYTSMRRFEDGGFFYWSVRWIKDWFHYIFTRRSSFTHHYPIYR